MVPLDQFVVSFSSKRTGALLNTASSEEASNWSLEELHPGLVTLPPLLSKATPFQLKCWQWLEEY